MKVLLHVGAVFRGVRDSGMPIWTFFPLARILSHSGTAAFRSDAEFARLSDLRPGSVSGIVRRCGKPTCHCAQPEDPGHGPSLRLTYKLQGKLLARPCPPRPLCAKPSKRSASSAGCSPPGSQGT